MKTIILTILIVIIAGCSNDNGNQAPISKLPPITQTGANTFGCLIDGKVLIPRDGSGTFGGSDKAVNFLGGYPNSTDYYEFDIKDFKSQKTASILIHIQSAHQNGIGDYVINESNGMSNLDGFLHNYIHCRVFNEITNSYQYYRSFQNSGQIKITYYDFFKRRISGTFNCTIKNSSNPSDIIEITKGRFDFKWDALPNKIFP